MSRTPPHPGAVRALQNHIWYPRTYCARLPGAVFQQGRYATLAWAGTDSATADIFVPPIPEDADVVHHPIPNDACTTIAAARAEVLGLIDAAAGETSATSISVRATTCPAPRWLTATTMARGMQWGWTSRWMVRDLTQADGEWTVSEGMDIRELGAVPSSRAEEIPFVCTEKWDEIVAGATGRASASASSAPAAGEIVVLGAFTDDMLVGAVTIHVNGHDGSSGLWDAGVAPTHRRKGLGRALVNAALRAAQQRGAHEMALNSTDEGLGTYLACGFVEVGRGQTWWFTPDHPASVHPTPQEIVLATAIIEDDAAAIAALPSVSAAALPCGLTPLRLAARTDSPAAARALVDRGHVLDVLSAWELGWKDEARHAAAAKNLVNVIDAEHRATPLHIAVRDDDEDLARLLLAAEADLDAKDDMYGSNPARWAEVLNKQKMAKLLAEAAAERQHTANSS